MQDTQIQNILKPASPFAAFHSPNYRNYQIARLAILFGRQMQIVATGWQIYTITQQPINLGYVGLAAFVPGLLFTLVGGHIADYFDRRKVLIASAVLYALCMAALAGLSILTRSNPSLITSGVYLCLFFLGVAFAFGGPAGQSLIAHLVPALDYKNAITLNISIFQLATVVGPAAGGFVYSLGPTLISPLYGDANKVQDGAILVYSLAALFNLFAVVVLLLIPVKSPQDHSRRMSFKYFSAGINYVWSNKIILGALSLDLFAILLGGATALLPIYARDILHIGPAGLGGLYAAEGLGALAMSFVVVYRPVNKKVGRTLFLSVTIFGLAICILGISTNFYLSLIALLVAGAVDMISVVIRRNLTLINTPDEMRGRVSAVNQVFLGASNELGQFESGLTAHWFGTVPAVVLGGLGTCLVVLTWKQFFPQLMDLDEI